MGKKKQKNMSEQHDKLNELLQDALVFYLESDISAETFIGKIECLKYKVIEDLSNVYKSGPQVEVVSMSVSDFLDEFIGGEGDD